MRARFAPPAHLPALVWPLHWRYPRAAAPPLPAPLPEENGKKDGVVTLPSGLQYKVISAGDGANHPTVDSPCECHYEGRTAGNYPSGPKFDSSYDRGSPTTFAPNQVIKGWTEAMQLMVEGDKWELYIPSDLAYGDRGRPPKIGGGECQRPATTPARAALTFHVAWRVACRRLPRLHHRDPQDQGRQEAEGLIQDTHRYTGDTFDVN